MPRKKIKVRYSVDFRQFQFAVVDYLMGRSDVVRSGKFERGSTDW